MLAKITIGLAALTAAVHIFIGGADALAPTLSVDLPLPAEGAMHACWHIVSAFLIWSVVIFWRGGAMAFQFGVFWIVTAIIFIYVGLYQGGLQGLITNPQWTILAVTGGAAVLSNRNGIFGTATKRMNTFFEPVAASTRSS